MVGWQIAITVLMTACVGSFAWAIAAHFRRSALPNRKMRLLTLLGMAAFALQLSAVWLESVAALRVALGLALLVSSLVLFWWAVGETRRVRLPVAFDASHSSKVVATGPYSLVRHPFYLSYSIAWLGGAVGTSAWWAWIVPMGFIPVYLGLAMSEERALRHLPAPHGAEYERYRDRTGMIFPRLFVRSIDASPSRRSTTGA